MNTNISTRELVQLTKDTITELAGRLATVVDQSASYAPTPFDGPDYKTVSYEDLLQAVHDFVLWYATYLVDPEVKSMSDRMRHAWTVFHGLGTRATGVNPKLMKRLADRHILRTFDITTEMSQLQCVYQKGILRTFYKEALEATDRRHSVVNLTTQVGSQTKSNLLTVEEREGQPFIPDWINVQAERASRTCRKTTMASRRDADKYAEEKLTKPARKAMSDRKDNKVDKKGAALKLLTELA